MTKSITLRLPKDEYEAFSAICMERGYSKTGKIREFIRTMVKNELGSVSLSVGEWKKISSAIKEIERGEYVFLEDLKRDFAEKKLAHNKGRK
jgi:hypothetical protein